MPAASFNMSKFHSYIASAEKIIGSYKAGKPFSLHARAFFALHKKYGSKDRKVISSLCYVYFRTGLAFRDLTMEEKILNGIFLCENKPVELLGFLKPALDAKISLLLEDKMSLLGVQAKDIFPFTDELTESADDVLFALSFLKQPLLYIRTRPGRKGIVTGKLDEALLKYECIGADGIRLDNSVAVDKILQLNRDAVIQDFNSQHVLDYMDELPALLNAAKKITTWDCCAASGGKSILLFDKLKRNIQLTVSDIRENILTNLRERFRQAGVNVNRSFVTDLTVSSGLPLTEKFSLIICDAPCTGSGTWARTPEQLCFFGTETIEGFAERQKQIISNVLPHLEKQGVFVYITCSVFKKENEEQVSFVLNRFTGLQLLKSEYLLGYETLSDSMFVAYFQLNGRVENHTS